MISRRILAAAALLCAFAQHAQAQPYTKSQLNSQIGVTFPDNTTFQITPQNERTIADNIVNSIMPTAPVGSGNIPAFDGTTGLLKDSGIPAFSAQPGAVKMFPLSPQSTDPTVPWHALDPFGNAINCAGTNSQCFNEMLAAARTNGWSWSLQGPGTLQTSVQIVIPPCSGRSEYIDPTVNINWTTSQGSADNLTIDSLENCYQVFRGVVEQHSGDTGTAVRWKPTNGGAGHIVGTASYAEFFTSIIPASGGAGLIWDLGNGSIFGNSALIWNDINGGVNGFIVTNPGSGSIVFENNKIYPGYAHGQTGKVVQVGTGSTNAARMKSNTWNPVRIDTDANPTVGWDSWASNDTYLGLSVVNETGIAGVGLQLESSATGNKFFGGSVTGTVPLVTSVGNFFFNALGIVGPMIPVSSFSQIGVCVSTTEGTMAAVTDSTTATWGATITGSSTNHVLAYCDGTNWTVAGK